MKKVLKSLLVLTIIATFFVSCKKDSPTVDYANDVVASYQGSLCNASISRIEVNKVDLRFTITPIIGSNSTYNYNNLDVTKVNNTYYLKSSQGLEIAYVSDNVLTMSGSGNITLNKL